MYCWRKSADYFEPTRATPFALRNRLSLSTCAARYRQSSGVKQGCVLAPTLFSLMFSTMLTDAFRDCDAGVRIRHNARREVVQPETSAGRHKGEGDCNQGLSLCGRLCPQRQKQEIQLEIDRLSTACDNFGLSISLKKTEVMFQPAPSNPYQEPIITVKGEKLQAVENFTYLGITLSNNIISKVSSAFGRLRKTFWERRGIHLAT